ncbi:MAG: DHH family phosphoesterase [Clostridia bacterium]|nr:DHH family phosphoesterase [Clostridia bacterium]
MQKRNKPAPFYRRRSFWTFLWAVLSISILSVVLVVWKDSSPLIVGACVLGFFLLSVYLTRLIWRIFQLHKTDSGEDIQSFSTITYDFLHQCYLPVAICDRSDQIVWYNPAFSELFHTGRALYGQYLDRYCTATAEQILSAKDPEGLPVGILPSPSVKGTRSGQDEQEPPLDYMVKGYEITADGLDYCILIWNDRHDLSELKRKTEEADSVVGYIVIDNLDEISQHMQDQERIASANVDAILKSWITSMNGIIEECEHNRYLAVFPARNLPKLIEDRFSVLNDVREVRVGASGMPVTVSIGLSCLSENYLRTPSEKAQDAKAALDQALQRGGDQVAYHSEEGIQFFGGKTKATQKKTKIRSRVMANELESLIRNASNILIMGHRNTDHDSIGSCLGMYRFCVSCGQNDVRLVFNYEDQNARVCLSPLLILPQYEGVFIDEASAPDYNRTGTLLIICDVSNPSQFQVPELFSLVKNCVIIDHHRKTGNLPFQPLLNYIDPSASSASELISEMLEEKLPLGTLPEEEANLLLAGMLLDTDQFTRNTGVRTYSAALYLRKEGANPAEAKLLFQISLEDYQDEMKFGSNVIIYRNKIAIAECESSDSSGYVRIAAARAADRLLSVSGVIASFTLVCVGDTVFISGRSRSNVNVQQILESLNGGGHFDAAGAQTKGVPVSKVTEQLRAAIDAYLDEAKL